MTTRIAFSLTFALAVCGFATVLTLILVPCLLAVLNDFRVFTHFLLRQHWPNREEVEPARLRSVELFQE